jgi:uncharacterized glyoxalase superfamily protein PhnB
VGGGSLIINPYLILDGQCKPAFEFYALADKGQVRMPMQKTSGGSSA